MGIFKKGKNRAQKQEVRRQRQLVKDLDAILQGSDSVQDKQTRVEVVYKQIESEGQRRVDELKKTLGRDTFQSFGLKAQDGKGKDIEQKIIDLFAPETLSITQTLLGEYMMAHDAWVKKELLGRPASSLEVELLD